MRRYSIEPRTRKYVKGYRFLLFDIDFYYLRENITTVIGYRTRCCKNYFQKSKSNDDKIVKPDENPRNIEKITIQLEKREML